MKKKITADMIGASANHNVLKPKNLCEGGRGMNSLFEHVTNHDG
ncbi:MAG: hypothetical protein AEth_01120 [Candidatus Argoarchaeum ethanivorans]|uniref:Uncharacterized protein n=1 Tax=Candidatus Argoarchaeum ethanivorans TaxID=2608793 RepID=A0A8B3S1X5_9EURY|nr:MAG: hypothetical protein AEth_01120 [Candidatus Argoarchaeum ethanivorans]